jgi:hypothetical protein
MLGIHGIDEKTVSIDASGRAAAVAIANVMLIEEHGLAHGIPVAPMAQLSRILLDFIRC